MPVKSSVDEKAKCFRKDSDKDTKPPETLIVGSILVRGIALKKHRLSTEKKSVTIVSVTIKYVLTTVSKFV